MIILQFTYINHKNLGFFLLFCYFINYTEFALITHKNNDI